MSRDSLDRFVESMLTLRRSGKAEDFSDRIGKAFSAAHKILGRNDERVLMNEFALATHFVCETDASLRAPQIGYQLIRRIQGVRAKSPSSSQIHAILAGIHYRNGKWDESVQAAERAMAKFPAPMTAVAFRSMAHWQLSRDKSLSEKQRKKHLEESEKYAEAMKERRYSLNQVESGLWNELQKLRK